MKNLLLLVVLLVKLACSHQSSSSVNSLPDWVQAPASSCPDNYLCAVGSGSSYAVSVTKAKAQLAMIFSEHISLEQDYHRYTKTQLLDLSYDQQHFNESLQSLVDQSLRGVEVFLTQKTGAEYYSLVRLNRLEESRRLEQEIRLINARAEQIHRDQAFYLWSELKKMQHDCFFKLNHLKVLRPQLVVSCEYLEKVLEKRLAWLSSHRPISITANFSPHQFDSLLSSVLTARGHRLASDLQRDSSTKLALETQIVTEPINVNGFKRWQLKVSLRRLNSKISVSDADKTGKSHELKIFQDFISTQRNEEIAIRDLRQQLKSYLEENLSLIQL